MLKLIVGTAKSGKTTEMLNRICALSLEEEAAGALLIVPEQASFNNERAISEKAGKNAGKISVVSFSRLAEQTLRRLGGFDKPIAAPAAEKLFMSMAISEAAKNSPIYGGRYRSRGFIEQAVQMINELRNAGISPEKLAKISSELENGPLSQKVGELAVIYGAFEAMLKRSYISAADMIRLAAKRLEESGELCGKEIFIDDFGSFTEPELEMLNVMLRQAKNVTVTLCCDDIPTFKPAFALTGDTAKVLRKAAAAFDVGIEKTVVKNDSFHGALASVEQAQQNDDIPDEEEGDGSVEALLCQSCYDELEQAAARISEMVRSNGVRYRDIAVIARDMTRYRFALPSVFARFEIPFFLDERRDARAQLLTSGLLAAVKAAVGVYGGDCLEAARSPLMGLEEREISALENYCYIWSLKNSDWKKPFVKNPEGMSGRMSDSAAKRLERLENCRRKIFEPIERLSTALKNGGGKETAGGIWNFLVEINAAGNIVRFADDMAENERKSFLEEQSLLWQQLVALLNIFAAVSDEFRFEPERVCELLETAFGEFEVATIPRTLDEVTVGTADRIRCDNVKTVILLGAVDGEFPSADMPGGIFSEPERRSLCETLERIEPNSFKLFTEGERSFNNEAMLCYRAVTSPSERLIVCCPKTDAAGAVTSPSDIFLRAAAVCKKQSESPYDRIWTGGCLQKALAESALDDGEVKATLTALGGELLGKEKTALLLGGEKAVHSLGGRDITRALYGEQLHISPSRLEQYYKCPFSYFMQKGLKAYKLQRAELSPAQAGTLIHLVLERLVSAEKRGDKPFWELEDDALRETVIRITAEYMAECFGGEENVPARIRSGMEHICTGLLRVIKHLGEELKQSEFVPVAFEMRIGKNGVEPVVLQTESGDRISVEGVVDRVDTATINGKGYLRVVDYKSGSKTFSLGHILSGFDLQMLIYLFSIAENGKEGLQSLSPAAVLYLPALGGYTQVGRDKLSVEDGSAEKGLVMSGILLDNESVLRGMERNLEGRFIPVGGRRRNPPVYSEKQFEQIKTTVRKKITEMAQRLYDGEIEALPRILDNNSPCDRCDYKTVCGFESCDCAEYIPPADTDEIFREEESENGEKLDS